MRSVLENCASENRLAPQGGVESVERHRGHQQIPARLMPAYQADAWVVRGKFSSRQNWNTKPDARASKPRRISKNTDTPLKIRSVTKATAADWLTRCKQGRQEKHECDRCRPLLAQQGPEKEQDKQKRKRKRKRKAQDTRYIGNHCYARPETPVVA